MVAYYKYLIEYIPSIYTRERVRTVYYALDAEDLAVQFYEDFHHVDYEIIAKERVVVVD